jgi:hypothetical protein
MKKFTTLLFIIFVLTGCGYTNPYAPKADDGQKANNSVSIYVDMWHNHTAELGYHTLLKQSLVRWLKKSPKFSISPDRNQADYILGGTIHSARYPGLSYGTFNQAIEIRAEIKVSFKLENNKTSELVLNSRQINRREAFIVGDNAADTESNKRQALRVIADDIAENIYIQIFYKFSRDDMSGIQDDVIFENNVDD